MSLLHKSCSLSGVCILGFLHNNEVSLWHGYFRGEVQGASEGGFATVILEYILAFLTKIPLVVVVGVCFVGYQFWKKRGAGATHQPNRLDRSNPMQFGHPQGDFGSRMSEQEALINKIMAEQKNK